MRWSPSMMSKLTRVREVRMRLAEMELVRADAALAACKHNEERARHALVEVTERSTAEAVQADQALLNSVAGGRRGISEWQAARKRAQRAVEAARGKVDEAVSDRVTQELACTTSRNRWRQTRFDMERLKLLTERLSENAG